jgi:hypothetical protein
MNCPELVDLILSDMCERDKVLWHSNVPLIFFYVVELHLPSRVLGQFGTAQAFPLETPSTSKEWHK